ncbi:MAG TPA: AMP-binding protein [Thermoplasmata archaeon]|nr:AMP-binding protein [Thermoplasmata archaeon]
MIALSVALDLLERGDIDALSRGRVEVPDRFNWAQDVFEGRHMARNPDHVALIWADDQGHELHLSYQEFVQRANRFLNLLRRQGLKEKQPIFVMLPVFPEVWFSYYAAIKGGFVLVPGATILTPSDLEYRFRQLRPGAVLADGLSAKKIDWAEMSMGQPIPIKLLAGGERPGWTSVEASRTEPAEAAAAATRSSDPLFEFFTSGTTGLPKVVTHTHESYPIGHLTTSAWIGVRPGDVHSNISQAGWAKFAWSSFFAPWNVGATNLSYHYSGRFDARRQLEVLQEHAVTTFCAPPTVWRMFILEDLSKYHFRFRECVSAGEPLNPEVIDAWRKGTGVTLRDGYGQTESTLMVGNLPGREIKPGSVGWPSFLYDVRVVDEQGVEAKPGKEGNIAVHLRPRPPGLFAGYLGASPEVNAKAFRGEWYLTGDRAYRDPDGRFWFVGRADDVIKSSDYRIGPFEVESALIEHPAVAEAAVVGSPDPVRGALVKAFVILRPGEQPSADLARDIFLFSRTKLAPYKIPRILEFSTELPKTLSGKTRRNELRMMETEARKRKERHPNEFLYSEVVTTELSRPQ